MEVILVMRDGVFPGADLEDAGVVAIEVQSLETLHEFSDGYA